MVQISAIPPCLCPQTAPLINVPVKQAQAPRWHNSVSPRELSAFICSSGSPPDTQNHCCPGLQCCFSVPLSLFLARRVENTCSTKQAPSRDWVAELLPPGQHAYVEGGKRCLGRTQRIPAHRIWEVSANSMEVLDDAADLPAICFIFLTKGTAAGVSLQLCGNMLKAGPRQQAKGLLGLVPGLWQWVALWHAAFFSMA
nr:uncharacterized protein LOC110362683 isoform X3 [Columba livia]